MKLRDYQEECVETVEKLNENEKALIMIPTGGGKTICFSEIAARAKGRVLITVPSTELREQAEEKLKMVDPDLSVGSVQGNLDEVDAKVVVATRQSLTHSKSNRLDRMLEHGEFEYLVIDEAHQAPKQLQKVLRKMNKSLKTLAFTATPYTRECIEMFGQPIFRRTILDMIDSNYLVEPYAVLVQSKTNISHVKSSKGDFNQGELEQVVNNVERNRLIIESYKKYASDRKLTLVFAAGCDHGKELLREFTNEGIPCDYVDGETSKENRKEIIDNFKKKKIKVLINVMTLTTGFDVPETDCILICRPSQSRILYEQIIGRGLRIAEGKTDCLIIDIQDIVKRHNLMDVSTIFETNIRSGETLRKAKKRIEDEKAKELKRQQEIEMRRKAEEERRHKELEIVAQRVKLFNRDMKLGFENRKYDWYRCDNQTYSLTYGNNLHYAIEANYDGLLEANRFYIYEVNTDKENKRAEYIDSRVNISDAIEYIEKIVKINTYTDPKSDWKRDTPTEQQLKFCGWAKSKWEVSKYFSSKSIPSTINKAKKEGTQELFA